MEVIVRSKTMPVTAAMRNFIRHQAAKVSRLSNRVSQVCVYLEQVAKKRNDPQASIVKYQVKLPGKDVVVRRRAVDMYEAVTEATQRAMRQVKKLKEKRRRLSRGGRVREDQFYPAEV